MPTCRSRCYGHSPSSGTHPHPTAHRSPLTGEVAPGTTPVTCVPFLRGKRVEYLSLRFRRLEEDLVGECKSETGSIVKDTGLGTPQIGRRSPLGIARERRLCRRRRNGLPYTGIGAPPPSESTGDSPCRTEVCGPGGSPPDRRPRRPYTTVIRPIT